METNKLYCMDNLELMKSLPSSSIDLIYGDILYGTGRDFGDYKDLPAKRDIIEEFYIPRIKEMHRVLKDTGSIYLQMDYRINHWIRIIMDDIFGYENFRNEITRRNTNSKNNSNNYGRIYDNIIYYTKTDKYTFNKPVDNKTESELKNQYNKKDRKGLYTTVPLHAKGETKKGETGTNWSSSRGLIELPSGRHWCTNHSILNQWDEDGLIEWSKNNNPRKKLYASEHLNKPTQNIWDYRDVVKKNNEYYYATQKPKELLDKIIRASSNKGDVVADFFLGSGTTIVVAEELDRKWIGCDINPKSIEITNDRLSKVQKSLF